MEECIIVINSGNYKYCVSATLTWILSDTSSNCQLFHFMDGGALSLPDTRCAQILDSQVKFSTDPCDNFTYSKMQFQFTKRTAKCIRFLENIKPVLDVCDKLYQYEKEKP